MFYYIVVLLPSLVGVEVYKKLNNDLTLKQEITFYLIQLLLTNIASTFVAVKFFGCTYDIQKYLTDLPLVAVKYAILSLIMTVVISMVINILTRVVRMELNISEKAVKKISKNTKKSK